MTQDEINQAIYTGFYTAIPNAAPLDIKTFMFSKISDTWPPTPAPALMPNYWYDRVALEIQYEFLKEKQYLPGLDGTWIAANTSSKWSDVADWAFAPGGLTPYP